MPYPTARQIGIIGLALIALIAGCAQPQPPADSVPPTITDFTATATADDRITASLIASDNVAVTSVLISVDGGTPAAASKGAGDAWAWTSPDPFPPGMHVVSVEARDAAGNSATTDPVSVTIAGGPSGPVFATQVGAGLWFSIALDSDGNVYGWGSNLDGRIGLGLDASDRDTPQQLGGLSGITQIASGGLSRGFAVDADGNAYSWGGAGALGHDDDDDHLEPGQIPDLADIVQIAAGSGHAIALDADGNLYGWGDNFYGQLGLGNTLPNYHATPQDISAVGGIVRIAANGTHTLAIDANGDVYSWGNGGSGRLGLGDSNDRSTPTQIPGLSNVVDIAAGGNHSMALDDAGNLYVWGANSQGQLGLGDFTPHTTPQLLAALPDVVFIAAGVNSSFAIDADGNLHSWGQNTTGQLGHGDDADRNEPEQIAGLGDVSWVAASGFHAVAVDADGKVYSWGRNENGELGVGDDVARDTPTALPFFGSE